MAKTPSKNDSSNELKGVAVTCIRPPVASSTKWTKGLKVAFVSAKEAFGATRSMESDTFDNSMYAPHPISEITGCNLISSVLTFCAMSGEVKLALRPTTVKGKVGQVLYVTEVTTP